MITLFGIQFGSQFPSTEKVEEQRKKLILDLERFNAIEGSATYLRFKELAELVTSGAFEKSVLEYKNFKYEGSSTFLKLKKYKALKGERLIAHYHKMMKKDINLDKLVEIANSKELSRFIELEKIISTTEFTINSQKPGFETSEHGMIAQEFQKLQQNQDIIMFQKNGETSEFKELQALMVNKEVREFISLELEIDSEEFKKLDAGYANRNRYKLSEEYSQLTEYNDLKKSEDIIWYGKIAQNKGYFSQLNEWKLTFEDDFDGQKLDQSKWMTSYYWGQALLNDSYVTADDKQAFKAHNVAVKDSNAKISLISEKCSSKVWEAEKGFYTSNFNFSSGIINNGHAFRQSFGKIEAKVRFSQLPELTQVFWLAGEKSAPHINVFKSFGKKGATLEVGKFVQVGDKLISNLKPLPYKDLGKDFHIYCIEWSKDNITWKINDVVVATQSDNIPQEAMYINFSSHLKNEVTAEKLPTAMEIDWVRCYSKN